MAKREVWYFLVHETGRLVEGTSVDKVYVSCIGDIADFRDAVRAKNPTKLSHCDPSGLVVYANKEAFERNDQLNPRVKIGEELGKNDELYVVVPASKQTLSKIDTMTITINEKNNDALAEYQAVGNLIHSASQPYFTEIWKKINELCNQAIQLDNESMMPFAAVEGSSGMGKTQLAFSLGPMGRPYFYWTATTSVRTQPIYRNFQSISAAFDGCVRKDIISYKRFQQDCEPNATQSLLASNFWRSRDLWTFGFLHILLKKHLSTKQKNGMIYYPKAELKIMRCSLKNLKKCINEFTGDMQVPIFILDEMAEYKKDKLYATFCRDLFRVCCLLVVVMGTDSKIANMIGDGMQSRSFRHKWLCLITKFPVFVSHLADQEQIDTWKELTDRFSCLSNIAKQSRGLFSKCFIEYCVNHWESEWNLARKDLDSDEQAFCMVLNKSLEHVGKSIREWKCIMNMENKEAVESHAYAVSYSNVDYNGNDRESKAKRRKLNSGRQEAKTIVMNNHFANLERSDIIDVYVDNSGFLVDKTKWSPKCYFPQVENDLLLYLAVLGCRNCPVFFDLLTNTDYSTRHILEMFEKVPMHENVNEVSRSGSYLENMLAIGVVTCSRRNGVEGIALDEFMEYFLGEFSEHDAKKKKLTFGTKNVSISSFCKTLEAQKIPFLTPVNGAWPRFLKSLNGCFFGDLVRPPRQSMCDLLIKGKPWFIGEAKNWMNNLNSAELYKIIMKRWVKRRWKFGLIMTNGIIRTMFGTRKKEHLEVIRYIQNGKINVVKVNCQSGEAQYLLQDRVFGEDAKRLLVILYHWESDSTDEGNYEITLEESRDISLDFKEMRQAEAANEEKEKDTTALSGEKS
jgi:hypothetical protein